MVGAPACGDVMKLQIKVNPATGLIEDARFKTYGCGSAIASSSLVTEWVKGKTLDQAMTIKNTQIAEELALPPVKIHCSILAEDAIKAAVEDYKAKHGDAALRPEHDGRHPSPKRRPGMSPATSTGAARAWACAWASRPPAARAWPTSWSTPTRSRPNHVVFEGHGVKVLVDPKSLPYIDGTELDFVREGLNEGFKFHNPREKDRCGCGESFRV